MNSALYGDDVITNFVPNKYFVPRSIYPPIVTNPHPNTIPHPQYKKDLVIDLEYNSNNSPFWEQDRYIIKGYLHPSSFTKVLDLATESTDKAVLHFQQATTIPIRSRIIVRLQHANYGANLLRMSHHITYPYRLYIFSDNSECSVTITTNFANPHKIST